MRRVAPKVLPSFRLGGLKPVTSQASRTPWSVFQDGISPQRFAGRGPVAPRYPPARRGRPRHQPASCPCGRAGQPGQERPHRVAGVRDRSPLSSRRSSRADPAPRRLAAHQARYPQAHHRSSPSVQGAAQALARVRQPAGLQGRLRAPAAPPAAIPASRHYAAPSAAPKADFAADSLTSFSLPLRGALHSSLTVLMCYQVHY